MLNTLKRHINHERERSRNSTVIKRVLKKTYKKG